MAAAPSLITLGLVPRNETQALAGTGSQTSPVNRWGDYSTISVDPVDDCTMVFTGQFMAADGWAWRTFIHSFRLSTCR